MKLLKYLFLIYGFLILTFPIYSREKSYRAFHEVMTDSHGNTIDYFHEGGNFEECLGSLTFNCHPNVHSLNNEDFFSRENFTELTFWNRQREDDDIDLAKTSMLIAFISPNQTVESNQSMNVFMNCTLLAIQKSFESIAAVRNAYKEDFQKESRYYTANTYFPLIALPVLLGLANWFILYKVSK